MKSPCVSCETWGDSYWVYGLRFGVLEISGAMKLLLVVGCWLLVVGFLRTAYGELRTTNISCETRNRLEKFLRFLTSKMTASPTDRLDKVLRVLRFAECADIG